MMRFSERMKLVPEKQIQTEDVDLSLRCRTINKVEDAFDDDQAKYVLGYRTVAGKDILSISFDRGGKKLDRLTDKLLALAPKSLSVARVRYDLKSTQLDFLLESCEFEDGGLTIHHCDELLCHKRKCFQYENELRLIGGSFDGSPHRMVNGIVYLPIEDISNFVERVMVHPLADDGYVDLIKKICQHFGIQFWGRSKIYEFKRK